MLKWTLVLICLVCISAVAYFYIFDVRTERVESLRSLVDRNVRIGASPVVTRQLLASQGLDPSPLRRDPEASYNGHKYGNSPIIVVLKRGSARNLVTREDIYVIFVFNENNELVRFDVFPVFTGL
jgi:hypothetical protein